MYDFKGVAYVVGSEDRGMAVDWGNFLAKLQWKVRISKMKELGCVSGNLIRSAKAYEGGAPAI
jgi:hypothetical protein